MAEHEHSTIRHNEHLLLDQPLLRLPNELLRKNFRTAHFIVEKDTSAVKILLKDSTTAAVSGRASQQDVLKNIDTMIARMRGVKRKLTACAEDESRLHDHAAARIAHLDDLYGLRSVDDVKYELWSRKRLDRLLADYMLRHGYNRSARELAEARDMSNLVDVETFEAMSKVRHALLKGSVTEALAWCVDNKKELRKMESKLEFMLRYQQYVELVRTRDSARLLDAIAHAKKHLMPYRSTYPKEVSQACGILAYVPGSSSHLTPYDELYSPLRWTELADLFTKTHNDLLALPAVPLLHVALSSGLSALKTPACHSSSLSSASDRNDTDAAPTTRPTMPSSGPLGHGVCPICSTELNELARNVPYAHHTKSHVSHDPMVLPNGRVYGRQQLQEHASQTGVGSDKIRDPRTGHVYPSDSLRKVFVV